MSRFLHPIFLSVVLVAALSGCAAWDRAKTAALTPDPTTGEIPAQVVIREVPHVISNPLDIPAWLQIVGAVAGVVIAAAGGVVAKTTASTSAATQTLVELKKEQLASSAPPDTK